jgi:hypothetical protein
VRKRREGGNEAKKDERKKREGGGEREKRGEKQRQQKRVQSVSEIEEMSTQ